MSSRRDTPNRAVQSTTRPAKCDPPTGEAYQTQRVWPSQTQNASQYLSYASPAHKCGTRLFWRWVRSQGFYRKRMFVIVFARRNVFLRVCVIRSLIVVVNKGGWRSKKTKMSLAFTRRFLMAAWNKEFTFMLQVS